MNRGEASAWVRAELEMLGKKTPGEIRAFFADNGIVGEPGNPKDCPLAKHLQALLGDGDIQVRVCSSLVELHGPEAEPCPCETDCPVLISDDYTDILLPTSVAKFITILDASLLTAKLADG